MTDLEVLNAAWVAVPLRFRAAARLMDPDNPLPHAVRAMAIMAGGEQPGTTRSLIEARIMLSLWLGALIGCEGKVSPPDRVLLTCTSKHGETFTVTHGQLLTLAGVQLGEETGA